jgi:HPt (histidine-containing phosphotransfer) domain-containing protein
MTFPINQWIHTLPCENLVFSKKLLNFNNQSKLRLMKIDLSYLREMSGGNKELILEMISIFSSQVADFGKEMDQLLANGQYEALGKLAHKAKSSVSIMGLTDLAGRLKDLENSANEGKNVQLYSATVENFKKTTEEAVQELEIVKKNLELYF